MTAFPPLAPPTLAAPLNRFRGRVAAETTVSVRVEASGHVRHASALQRLEVRGVGDYVLTIPAPVVGVRRGPGSDSEPGQRRNAVLWQGFSGGRRTLSSRAELRPADVESALPLHVRLGRRGGVWTLEVANATVVTTESFAGVTGRPALERYAAGLRRAALDEPGRDAPYAEVTAIRPLLRTVSASFLVRGTLTFPGRRPVRFAHSLGGGDPLTFRLRARGTGRPRLALVADPARPRLLARPLLTLDAAIGAALSLGLTRQYESFLVNPDPLGRARTSYRYASAEPRKPTPKIAAPGGDGSAGIVWLLALGLAAPVLLALWARS